MSFGANASTELSWGIATSMGGWMAVRMSLRCRRTRRLRCSVCAELPKVARSFGSPFTHLVHLPRGYPPSDVIYHALQRCIPMLQNWTTGGRPHTCSEQIYSHIAVKEREEAHDDAMNTGTQFIPRLKCQLYLTPSTSGRTLLDEKLTCGCEDSLPAKSSITPCMSGCSATSVSSGCG